MSDDLQQQNLSLDAEPYSDAHNNGGTSGSQAGTGACATSGLGYDDSTEEIPSIRIHDGEDIKRKECDVVLVFAEDDTEMADRIQREMSEVVGCDGQKLRVALFDNESLFGVNIVDRPSKICEKSLLIFIIRSKNIEEDCVADFTRSETIAQTRIITTFHSSDSVRTLTEEAATARSNHPTLRGLASIPPVLWKPDDEGIIDDLCKLIKLERDEETRRNDRSAPVYPIGDNKRGVCLIINITEFRLEGEINPKYNRYAADQETDLLKDVFEKLNYDVRVHTNDTTAEKLEEIFDNVSKENHSQYDSFVCFIISHGYLNVIMDADVQAVDISELLNKLNSENLKDKPKLCFIEACRRATSPELPILSLLAKPFEETPHFYVCYSTSQNDSSRQCVETGDYFIHEFTKAIATRSKRSDLIGILGHVEYEMSKRKTPDKKIRRHWHIQKPEIVDGLKKRFYFAKPEI